MTQAILSASTQHQTAARQYLTAEQDWALVTQVKERTELLKLKKDDFTLEEHRIRIRGERAFKTLIEVYRRLIWGLVYRYQFSERITDDEMYQIAIIAVNYAMSRHNPNRKGKLSKFSTWVFLQVKCRFIDLYRSELSLARRVKVVQNSLSQDAGNANEQTPLKASLEAERDSLEAGFKEQLNQIITSTLRADYAQTIKEQYFVNKKLVHIAHEQGKSPSYIRAKNTISRKKLRENPKLRELAQAYFS